MATLRCPVCTKKLMLSPTMRADALVGCVNCNSVLRVVRRKPDRVEAMPDSVTHTAESKPESYG